MLEETGPELYEKLFQIWDDAIIKMLQYHAESIEQISEKCLLKSWIYYFSGSFC